MGDRAARRKESGLAAGFDCWSVPDVPAIDRIVSLDGDVIALLLALLGQLLGVVLECFLQGDVAGVGLGDFVAVSGLGVRVVRQVLELLGRALSRGGKDFVDVLTAEVVVGLLVGPGGRVGEGSDFRIFFRDGKVPVSAMV